MGDCEGLLLPQDDAYYEGGGCCPSLAAHLDEDHDSSALATSPCHGDANARTRRPPGTALPCFIVNENGARGHAEENAFESTQKLSCFVVNGNGTRRHAEENDRRENVNEATGEERGEDARKSEREDWSEFTVEEGPEENHHASDNDGGYASDDHDGGCASDGGYEFPPEGEEAGKAMQEQFMAEAGVADEAVKGRQRQQSWLWSVEWFVSWPLRRLSHSWRKVRREYRNAVLCVSSLEAPRN
ncbi:unnamed protein product [Closterium sp. NIES-54]